MTSKSEYQEQSEFHASWWMAKRDVYPAEFEDGVTAAVFLLNRFPAGYSPSTFNKVVGLVKKGEPLERYF